MAKFVTYKSDDDKSDRSLIEHIFGLAWLFPGYVPAIWNLPAISGILVAGVPVEELLFAASLGAMWSSVYEHFGWYRFS